MVEYVVGVVRVPVRSILRPVPLPHIHEGLVAQLVEQGPFKPEVVGSTPTQPMSGLEIPKPPPWSGT